MLAIRPQSISATVWPYGSGASSFRMFPGWGSAWNNPVSKSYMRNASCATFVVSLISSVEHLLSFTSSIHSETSTRRVHMSS